MSAPRGKRTSAFRLDSVGTKLAGATLLLLSVVTAVAYYGISRSERERALVAKETAAVMVARLFASGAQAAVAFDDDKSVHDELTLLLADDDVVFGGVWAVTAADGPVATSFRRLADAAREGTVVADAPVMDAEVHVQRHARSVLVQTPVRDAGGKLIGVVRVGVSLDRENAAIASAQRRALWSALGFGLGLSLILILLTRTLIVRRLAKLAEAAARLQAGETAQVTVDGHDEVAALARAFSAMSSAIESREAQISTKNRDMRRVLDNVDEGFLTVDLKGGMSDERSRIVDQWFGTPQQGDDFFGYVERFGPTVAHSLRNGWRDIADDFLPIEVILDQLPTRLPHGDRHFAFEYREIRDEDVLTGIIVTIKDVTAAVRHEIAERSQREALAIFRRVLTDRSGFEEFLGEGSRLVSRVQVGTGDPVGLRRDIHTLKGICAVYGLESVSSVCHAIEDRLADGQDDVTNDDVAALGSVWATVVERHGELTGGAEARLDIGEPEYLCLVEGLRTKASHAALLEMALGWRHEAARTRLDRASDLAHSLARRLGKGDVKVTTNVNPPGLRLPQEAWSPFWTVFPHLLRNALDHGIESAEERRAAGKDAGELRIGMAVEASEIVLEVADDGRGIAWDRIRAAAEKRGMPTATPADLTEALFTDRVSSRDAVTETSGRGVGMGAVRAAVLACHGRVEVGSEPGRGTTFKFYFPRTMLGVGAIEMSKRANHAA